MAKLQRSNMPDLTLVRGIHMIIQNDWEQREAVGRTVFNVYDSEQHTEDTKSVGAFGMMSVIDEGFPVEYDSPPDGFRETFTHLKYGKGFRVTDEMQDDELYNVIEQFTKDLVFSAHATEESVLAGHFNTGFSTTGYDGIALFATNHVRENGDTWANEPTTATDLTQTSLEAGIVAFRNFRDGGGKRLQIRPKKLIVAPDNQFVAAKLLNSTLNPSFDSSATADGPTHTNVDGQNASNVLSTLGLSLQVWDYLSDGDAWFLQAGPDQHKMILYERKPFKDDMIYDFDTGDLKVKVTYRQSSGWAHANGMYGSPGG